MSERRADDLLAVVVAATIVAAAFGSAIERDLFHVGLKARWGMLLVFGCAALLRAFIGRRTWRLNVAPTALVALFCGLSLVSVTWSAAAYDTLGRAAGEIGVAGAAVLLAGCVAADPHIARRLIEGVLGAVTVIAVGSLVYLATDPHGTWGAFQAASVQYPERFRGLEFNPNTLAMLLAIGLPITVAVCADRRRGAVMRVCALGLLVVFIVELALTGSRGGLLAGFGASFVVAVLVPESRRIRGGIVAAVAIALVCAAIVASIPKALPGVGAHQTAAAATQGINAENVLPLEGEIGNPWWTHKSGTIHRTLLSTSVRLRALKGAIRQGFQRPLLGWGFGAETSAFTNRYYGFDSQNPENGYVGIFLQLGIVGFMLLLAMLLACFVTGARATLRSPTALSAATVGVAVAALLLALSQSYFHGPGGIAFVAVWIALALSSVIGLAPAQAPRAA